MTMDSWHIIMIESFLFQFTHFLIQNIYIKSGYDRSPSIFLELNILSKDEQSLVPISFSFSLATWTQDMYSKDLPNKDFYKLLSI